MIRINTQLKHKGQTFASGMVIVLDCQIDKIPNGNRLAATVQGFYASDAIRQADPIGNATTDHGFPERVALEPYDRVTHGTDVLQLAHDRYKQALVGIGIAEADIEIFGL